MVSQETEKPRLSNIIGAILLSVMAVVLPGVQWAVFGWLHMFLPLLAFFLLWKHGAFAGKRILLTSVVISLLILVPLKSFDLLIFSVSLLFAGYTLYRSAKQEDAPALSGLKGIVVLAGGWLLVMSIFSIGAELTPYSQLLKTLDEGMNEALVFYRQSESVSADTLLMLETTLFQMKEIVPLILPAILGSMVLILVWFTMVIGNLLLVRAGCPSPWSSYMFWQLPEKLIWLIIITGALALIPIHICRVVGINTLILVSIVYCFQGLAIAVFFMSKWNVPVLFRSFFYVMIIFQSLGTVMLLVAGIADNWFDFRKLKADTNDHNQNE